GHVDHGKSSILDAIRQTRVAAGEAGGITQRIGAYKIETADGHPVVFIDTPGHEAFTAMRARGAQVTDLVVLVVAADDGVMPQTIEAIQHARAAKVPIIVAINKIDKDNANVDRVHAELAEQGIVTRHYGGEYECVHVSAKSGVGLDDLLTTIVLATEIEELKANPNRNAIGTIIDAHVERGRGRSPPCSCRRLRWPRRRASPSRRWPGAPRRAKPRSSTWSSSPTLRARSKLSGARSRRSRTRSSASRSWAREWARSTTATCCWRPSPTPSSSAST